MRLELAVTPSGKLHLEEGSADAAELDGQAAELLQRAFRVSAAEGLLLLASNALDQPLPDVFVFWRGFARDFFERLCHRGEMPLAEWTRLPEPSDDELAQRVATAPPMRGLEYLSPEAVRRLWQALRNLAA